MIKLNIFSDINEESLSVVTLHHHAQYMKQCCDLVNEEWPRSETARMLSLSTSCDKLPTCLILVTGDKQVIGHCKLTPIPSIPSSCFVESVVISKSIRGKGLGTFLMRASEEYCKKFLSLGTIHLSTKGQEKFYEKLGYTVCEPVSIYGGYFPANNGAPFKSTMQNTHSQFRSPLAPPMPSQIIDDKSSKPNKTFMVKSILP